MSDLHRPLSGLQVLDLTDGRGDLCGRLLAEFGADVVRVDGVGGGAARQMPPFADDGTSLYFAYRNMSKRQVLADLTTDEGRARVQTLAAGADVLIESGAPGSLEAVGLDPATLLEHNPGLVYASLTDFGQTGPYAQYASTDDVVIAMSGWLSSSGIPSKPPLLVPGSLASDTLSILGAFAILTGLWQRRSTGRGQHLDVSALEAVAQMNTWGLPNTSASLNAGHTPSRVRSGASPMYAVFPTSDGFVRLVILAPRQWHAMFEWLGRPEEFSDPAWADTFFRIQNLDVLNMAFEAHFAPMTMEACAEEAQRRGVVVTPMLKPSDILVNEHFVSRSTFLPASLGGGLEGPVMAGAMEIAAERCGFTAPPPEPGQDDEAVFTRSTTAADAPAPAGGPLTGIRVLDFGHGGVGVEGGRMLADYGAEVIKIESRTYPDFIRLVLGTEMTPSFSSSSRSKGSLGVNTKSDRGRELLLDLARSSHVVIENNSTGTMANMGLSFEDFNAANPDLVMVSSQMMGSRGAYSDWIGYGPTIQTVGGINHLWAFDDGEGPPGNQAIHPDHLAGRLCAVGGLAALLGEAGAHVEVAQVEALVYTIGDLLLAEGVSAGSARPEGNDDRRGAPWGVFPCAGDEAWAVVTVATNSQWHALRALLGEPEWADDAAFDTAAGRYEARDALNAGLAAWTATRSPDEVTAACQAVGVPAGAMLDNVDILTNEHFVARGFPTEIDQVDLGPVTLEGHCITGSDMAIPPTVGAPRLGADTRRIAREILGLSDDEIDALIAEGVLEVERD